MNKFGFILTGSFVVFSLITCFLYCIFKNKKYVKYAPAAAALVFGLYNVYQSRAANEGLADIAMMLIAFVSFAGALGSLLTGLLLDFYPKFRR